MPDAIRFLLNGDDVSVADASPQTTLLEFLRERRAAHRHQGRLRRGRLRRVHGDRRRAGRGRRTRLASGQRLHPAPAHRRRPRGVHRREPAGDRRQPAPGAGSAGARTRLAVRVLHAGLRDEPVRAVQARGPALARRRGHGAVRQPVPLHRLPADPRRRAGDVRSCRRPPTGAVPASTPPASVASAPRSASSPPGSRASPDPRAFATRTRGRRITRRPHSTRWRSASPTTRQRGSSPGAPTSACGSPSSSASLGDLIHTGRVPELRAIDARRRRLVDRRRRAAGPTRSRRSRPSGRSCTEAWERFASVPIRNAGTLGGNVANGSPIGDSMPLLIALGAAVVLRHRERDAPAAARGLLRRLPADGTRAGRVPAARPRAPPAAAPRCCARTRCRGATTRTSRRCSSRSGSTSTARASRGRASAAAASPPRRGARRPPRRVLEGRAWTEATARAAGAALATEFAPISDLRASADYRRQTARRACCWRCWLETGPVRADASPLRVQDVTA